MLQRPALACYAWFLVGIVVSAWGAEPPKDSLDRDYAGELPRIPPTEPDKALATFQVAPGFKLEQVAAEPLVVVVEAFLSVLGELVTGESGAVPAVARLI